jgi:hypothetical protein
MLQGAQMPGASATADALGLVDPLVPELKFSPNLLLTLIAQIYTEKIRCDRLRERQDNEAVDFPAPTSGAHMLQSCSLLAKEEDAEVVVHVSAAITTLFFH